MTTLYDWAIDILVLEHGLSPHAAYLTWKMAKENVTCLQIVGSWGEDRPNEYPPAALAVLRRKLAAYVKLQAEKADALAQEMQRLGEAALRELQTENGNCNRRTSQLLVSQPA